ncbi:MAG: hypothetical protein PHS17_18320 [Desulfobacterales bacterium]|nr:hypothetical protein [Desulfobacterales bacterium]
MGREERREYWHALIEKQARGGMSAAAFCKEQEINPQRFYSWRKRLNRNGQHTGFIRLVPTPSTTLHSGVRILLEHEICVEVDKGFDPITLRKTIDALCNRE